MQIKFQQETAEETPALKPIPAIKALPDWFKKMPAFTQGNKAQYFPDGKINLTVKKCNPLGDALGLGYFLLLENSIRVDSTDTDVPSLVWGRGGADFVSTHNKKQISAELIPKGFSSQPFKFTNDWSIQTPKGYSVLITHPLNANSKPFLTLSGVVDTDSYNMSVQLPFLIRSDFSGTIEAGTPIAQVIPFKREPWKSSFLEHDKFQYQSKIAEFERVMLRFYSKFHWKRKEFK